MATNSNSSILLSSALLLCSLCFSLYSCDSKKEQIAPSLQLVTQELYAQDSIFSVLLASRGMKASYIEMMDADATIIRNNARPRTGADAINYLTSFSDTGFILKWNPAAANASAVSDLGYTFGTYEIQANALDTTLRGSYIHIWKKQEDGSWKFVVDAWNDGLE